MFGRVTGGEVVAEETSEPGGRPYGVSSVHACDDGSRIAVRARVPVVEGVGLHGVPRVRGGGRQTAVVLSEAVVDIGGSGYRVSQTRRAFCTPRSFILLCFSRQCSSHIHAYMRLRWQQRNTTLNSINRLL